MGVDFLVSFWGVRGSLPVPGPDTAVYGGNTSCVQITIDKRIFIMDAGTGMFKLGQKLSEQNTPLCADIFITHPHWDHIQGFPFFAPFFKKENRFNIYGQPHLGIAFADIIRRQMVQPYFPITVDDMQAHISFHELSGGDFIDLGDGVTLKTQKIAHPGGCLAYRLDHAGRSCCYVTDTEHSMPANKELISFITGTDCLIYDSNFSDEEYAGYGQYSSKKGWGHSTWQEGVKLAGITGVKKLVLFHHANFRTDNDIASIEKQAQALFVNCVAAREGMVLSL